MPSYPVQGGREQEDVVLQRGVLDAAIANDEFWTRQPGALCQEYGRILATPVTCIHEMADVASVTSPSPLSLTTSLGYDPAGPSVRRRPGSGDQWRLAGARAYPIESGRVLRMLLPDRDRIAAGPKGGAQAGGR